VGRPRQEPVGGYVDPTSGSWAAIWRLYNAAHDGHPPIGKRQFYNVVGSEKIVLEKELALDSLAFMSGQKTAVESVVAAIDAAVARARSGRPPGQPPAAPPAPMTFDVSCPTPAPRGPSRK